MGGIWREQVWGPHGGALTACAVALPLAVAAVVALTAWRLTTLPSRTLLVQVVGNLAVFAALGALAPVRAAALRSVRRVTGVAAAASVAIEVAQYALALGRVTSVDDVLLNAVGAGLAAWATRPWWRPASLAGADRHRAVRRGRRTPRPLPPTGTLSTPGAGTPAPARPDASSP